jgi:ribosomal protein S25
VEEFLGVTRAQCVPSGPEYRLVIRGDPEIVHEPLRKAAEAPSGPDPAAEALIEPLLQALDAGIRTDVALAEHLKAPRHLVQEALRILAARGQVAAFASDGVCCWARVPPGSATEARESSNFESESSSDGREFEQDPRDSSSIPRDQSDEFAPISSNFDHDRADMDAISNDSSESLSSETRDMDGISNDSSDPEEVEMGVKKRKKTPREMSNSASIPRNSSRDGRTEMKERIMALARMRPITGSMVSNRLGIPHALAGELIGELLREGRLRVENTMLVPARPRF